MGSRQPLVSIVTPSLNQGEFIGEALASVAAQDYSAIEHIVVDGGSADGTFEAVRPYLDRITWICEPDSGQSDALNKGFRRARGAVLGWLNADDRLLPGAVVRAVEALGTEPDAAFVHGGGLLVDRRGEPLSEHRPPTGWGARELVEVVDFVLQPTAFFSRDALAAVGPLREDLVYTMDWDLFIRLARRGPILTLDDPPLAVARIYPETKTAGGGIARYREIVRLVHEHCGRYVTVSTFLHLVEVLERIARRGLQRIGFRLGDGLAPGKDRLARIRDRAWERSISRVGLTYPDGWAGPRLRSDVPGGRGPVVISGAIPAWSPLRDQRLVVRAGDALVFRGPVGPGRFELELPLPSDPLTISVKAARSFSPDRAGLTRGDMRRLAWADAKVVRRPAP